MTVCSRYIFFTSYYIHVHNLIHHPSSTDAWPISKRINHIITQLRIDEWREAEPGASGEATALKESKLEKLNTLLRILKNTADIDNHYPKKKIAIRLANHP